MRFVMIITGLLVILVACAPASEEVPPLADPGQPTLVFIYTDN